jgi:hypothetical protein
MAVDAAALAIALLPILLEDEPIPQHNSILTGALYYDEIFNSENEKRFYEVARMDKPTFMRLISFLESKGGLRGTRNLCKGERVMIFIHVLRGNSYRQTAERWQHSTDTIHSTIHHVADVFVRVQSPLFNKI